ncbi:ankyrin repeat domain-containing protein [Rhodococcus triatomae]|uniref:ankyrin repeat domain-containing protein n=1 Tax=Rhodococcus triatomae TaxID=300028 RepID=UPI0009344CF8|nr:ankyrin repeat domain-containing protein [Rhodococcus triatomae]QNG17771.1 ankyrin repeat domain-containing protein [Rhodococcus triatomae]QNG22561.1 ankyrin repeat domain-containing protein [Rhodococcus triatomae]
MSTDQAGRIPLHYAAGENNVDEVRVQLASGADVDAKDEENVTPLHFAAQHGALAAASTLLEAGADVNALNRHGNTPLWTALLAPRGNPAHPLLLALLIERGADPTIKNTSGRSVVDMLRVIAPGPKTEAITEALAARDQ